MAKQNPKYTETKGGNKISFSALVVIGDRKSRVGIGLDKAGDVMSAIQKAIKAAKKKVITINLVNGSIAHEVMYSKGSSIILFKPAPEGTGVIAGGSVRAVVEAAGIRNIVTKCLGTNNKALNVNASYEALKSLKPSEKKTPEEIISKIKIENKDNNPKSASKKTISKTVKTQKINQK